MAKGGIEKKFEKISQDLMEMQETLQALVPKAIVREVSSFGNSAHVILSKELADRKVGIIVLDQEAGKKRNTERRRQ